MNHDEQKKHARKMAINNGHGHEGTINNRAEWSQEERDMGGLRIYPSEKEYTGPGANAKEYQDVENQLKKHRVNRKPLVDPKHNMYE